MRIDLPRSSQSPRWSVNLRRPQRCVRSSCCVRKWLDRNHPGAQRLQAGKKQLSNKILE